MCVYQSPTSAVSMVAAIVQIAQAAYGVYRTVETIQVNNIQAEESANAARQSAELARQNAIMERQNAIDEARQKRLQTLKKMSEMKTDVAAGNIDVNSQTSLDKLESISIEGELDALDILNTAKNRTQKYLLAADSYESQANSALEKAKISNKNTMISVLGSGLKSAAKNYQEPVMSIK